METLATLRKKGSAAKYNPKPMQARLTELLDKNKESYREASLSSGLHHQAVRRIVVEGSRPDMIVTILLANHFGVEPNELLKLASWPPLKVFDIQTESAESLPPEAVQVAKDVAKIADPAMRKQVAEAIRTLLGKYFAE
jgi:hypothetical protein